MRKSPNVIITGTPGVGKTVHCEQLAQETGLRHLSINQVAKDRECYDGYDEERKSWIVDEDKVWNGIYIGVSVEGGCATPPSLSWKDLDNMYRACGWRI